MSKVRKAVIPAGGYGTRMLPISKTVSKEILPLVDKPIIQYVVEELVEAGIEDIIIVTSAHKTDLVDYFSDVDTGLLDHLKAGQKHDFIRQLEDIHKLANIAFIEQKGVYGNGTPILNAEPYLAGEPFIFRLADDIFIGPQNSSKQIMDTYEKYGVPVIGCQKRTADEDYDRYGYMGGEQLEEGVISITGIVEHPGKANAPGDYAFFGAYIMNADTLTYLHTLRDNLPAGKELYGNYAFNLMVEDGKQVLAREIVGTEYFDTGNKLGYMKTAVAMAAQHPEFGDDFRKYLKENY